MQRFEPLIVSESKMDGVVNEDVSQDVREELIQAIQRKVHESDLLCKVAELKSPYRSEGRKERS